MQHSGFLRCACGKLHSVGGITVTSVCTCSNNLWVLMNNTASKSKVDKPR
jgi:hypothetical protein